MSELALIIHKLNAACCPEEIFGNDLSSSFKKLARVCHPDVNKDPLAEQAFQKLTAIKEEADARVKAGTWGKKLPMSHCIPLEIGEYKVRRNPSVGDFADLYIVDSAEPLLLKVARSFEDNDLMAAEEQALKAMDGIKTEVREGIPRLEKAFFIDGIRKRSAHVITRYQGFWTAKEIHSVTHVDTRTAVWMFKRILSVLSWAHHFHIMHGAILPPHVMFYPDNDGGGVDKRKHTVRIIDWGYSVDFKKRTRLSSWVPALKEYYAPELLDKSYVGPESDIYMAAQLMIYLMKTVFFETELQKVITKCLQEDPKMRYRKATDALEDWTKAATTVFGAPKWHDFVLPTTPSGR